jgi:hypothetical protein
MVRSGHNLVVDYGLRQVLSVFAVGQEARPVQGHAFGESQRYGRHDMSSKLGSRMLEVVVGVTLTAVLGGLLVPYVKGHLDRRSERYSSSVALVDTLAESLWAYWHLAVRVAYYGRQGQRGSEAFELALRRWDSDDSWQIGSDVQTQLSRSNRFLPPSAQDKLVDAQQEVVVYLDREIDKHRDAATPDEWEKLYESLMTKTRAQIDKLLVDVIRDLKIGRTQER